MKKVKNKYHKTLTFPAIGVSLAPDTVVELDDSKAIIVLRSPWITEVNNQNTVRMTGEFTIQNTEEKVERTSKNKKDIKPIK